MYSEYRGERKCSICGLKRACCGDPPEYCRECADAILSGRPSRRVFSNERAMVSEEQYNGSEY